MLAFILGFIVLILLLLGVYYIGKIIAEIKYPYSHTFSDCMIFGFLTIFMLVLLLKISFEIGIQILNTL